MLERLVAWLKARWSHPPTAEELESERETKQLQDERETAHIEERESMRAAGR
jgi:hypothetical protein